MTAFIECVRFTDGQDDDLMQEDTTFSNSLCLDRLLPRSPLMRVESPVQG